MKRNIKEYDWIKWVKLPILNNHEINNIWQIRSLNYRNTWKIRILKSSKDKDWYLVISIRNKNKIKTYKVHRLVMLAFNWESFLQVNHINGIKNDNRLENLEYCTCKENQRHKFDILWYKWSAYWKFWKDNPKSIKVDQYNINWNFIKTWGSIINAGETLKIAKWSISKVCKGKAKTCWWFIWKYN